MKSNPINVQPPTRQFLLASIIYFIGRISSIVPFCASLLCLPLLMVLTSFLITLITGMSPDIFAKYLITGMRSNNSLMYLAIAGLVGITPVLVTGMMVSEIIIQFMPSIDRLFIEKIISLVLGKDIKQNLNVLINTIYSPSANPILKWVAKKISFILSRTTMQHSCYTVQYTDYIVSLRMDTDLNALTYFHVPSSYSPEKFYRTPAAALLDICIHTNNAQHALYYLFQMQDQMHDIEKEALKNATECVVDHYIGANYIRVLRRVYPPTYHSHTTQQLQQTLKLLLTVVPLNMLDINHVRPYDIRSRWEQLPHDFKEPVYDRLKRKYYDMYTAILRKILRCGEPLSNMFATLSKLGYRSHGNLYNVFSMAIDGDENIPAFPHAFGADKIEVIKKVLFTFALQEVCNIEALENPAGCTENSQALAIIINTRFGHDTRSTRIEDTINQELEMIRNDPVTTMLRARCRLT